MILTACTAGAVAALCTRIRRSLEREDQGPASFWKGRVRIKKCYNRGAAFGLPGLHGRGLIAASCAALLVFLAEGSRKPLAVGLVLGGGLSNLWERVRHGRVFDYVQLPRAPGRLRRYVFNLADFAILAGALALLRGRR